MTQYRFLGNPSFYKWDFRLTTGMVYDGAKAPFHRHTIEELYKASVKYKDKTFLKDWEEVSNV